MTDKENVLKMGEENNCKCYFISENNEQNDVDEGILAFCEDDRVVKICFYGDEMVLPECIGNLSALKELDISYTEICELPESIVNLSSLKALKSLADTSGVPAGCHR